MSGERPSEDDLIARYFAPLAGPGGLGLKDDAALIAPPPGCDLVLTVDALVAGVHFFADDPPGSIGRKALGVNLSDLAAKGADPLGFLLSLALPPEWTPDWLDAFAHGLGAMAGQGGCPLLGGDTVKTPGPLTLSITAFGAVPSGRMVRRTTARPGDLIAVTGSIGDAALGLQLRLGSEKAWAERLSAEDKTVLLDRYLHPQPRNALAHLLREHASAAMDVSDGLVGDCAKLLRASGVGGVLNLETVPLSDAARRACADPQAFETAITGGDDYEILFTIAPDRWTDLQTAMVEQSCAIPVTVIGHVTEGDAPLALLDNGQPVALERRSFSHF
jgi:thiamine-monophosphate kinase